MNIQLIPLTQLVPSPANVRKTYAKTGIEGLAASMPSTACCKICRCAPQRATASKSSPEGGGSRRSNCWRNRRRLPPIIRFRARCATARTRPKSVRS